MNDDLHFDAHDRELGRRFGSLAEERDDTEAVLTGLRPRLRRARRQRRAATVLGIAATAAALVAAVGVLGGTSDRTITTPPASHSTVSTPTPTSDTIGSGTDVPVATNPDPADSAPPAGSDDGSSLSPTAGRADDGAANATGTTPTGDATLTRTYTSAGGSVTVTLTNGSVALVSSSPASGYVQSVHDDGPTRVEVRFTDPNGEWRIRVDVVDGSLVPQITQHG
jgi:hypothetical protein